MSTKIKSIEFAELHKLADHTKLNEAHGFDIPADLYNDVVLAQCDITPEQLAKKHKLDKQFVESMVYVGGVASAERMKENKDLVEIGMTFPMGADITANAVFGRGEKVVVQVAHQVATAEMKRVLVHLNTLFEEVNN